MRKELISNTYGTVVYEEKFFSGRRKIYINGNYLPGILLKHLHITVMVKAST